MKQMKVSTSRLLVLDLQAGHNVWQIFYSFVVWDEEIYLFKILDFGPVNLHFIKLSESENIDLVLLFITHVSIFETVFCFAFQLWFVLSYKC